MWIQMAVQRKYCRVKRIWTRDNGELDEGLMAGDNSRRSNEHYVDPKAIFTL